MTSSIRARVVLVGLAAGLVSCATAPTPAPNTPPSGLSCGAFEFRGEIPEVVSPEKWEPKQCPRGYLSLRYVADGEQIFAIGVLVKDGLAYEPPFFVGPMAKVPDETPWQQAAKASHSYSGWQPFYSKLFKACGDSRPLTLVCSGTDCPKTPEIPPPGLLGTTASFGTGSITAVEPGSTERAYASRASGGGGLATDVVQGVLTQSPDARRRLVVDTVERAVCAAKILNPTTTTK
jgi:hypothetical protein